MRTPDGERHFDSAQAPASRPIQLPTAPIHLLDAQIFGEKVTDEDFRKLAAAPNLRSLSAYFTNQVGDAAMEQVARLWSLRTVRLIHCRVSDQGIRMLSQLKGLTCLHLRVPITDASLESLGKLPSLEELHVEQPARVTGIGLMHLRRCPRLDSLGLPEMAINDADLEHVAQMKGLRTLVVPHTQIGDARLERLRSLTNLESIDLGATRVTSQGMRFLVAMPALATVSLASTSVDDSGILDLAATKYLRRWACR